MKKIILFLLLLLIVGYLVWRWYNSDDQGAANADLAYDRVWIDHMPSKETDTVQAFAAITEEPFGVFDSSSLWKGNFELFRYKDRKDGKVKLLFPQNGDQDNVTVKATACKQGKFDYCLELSGTSRGTKKYYSQKGWEIGAATSGESVHARVDALVHALPTEAE